uniref:Ground-like domain-containing protein n=1 Tax=Elaeophora elaphi TaxID=1147741 RepID=A0A0R3RW71_9BILA
MKIEDGCNLNTLLISIVLLLSVSSCDTANNDTSCICPSDLKCKWKCLNGKNKIIADHSIRRREVDYEEVEIIDERKCNSKSLQNIMLQNMAGQTAKEAKTKIMRAAEALLGGYFNVICAYGDFSYITTTSLYCLQSLGNINCYAFLTGNIRLRLE